MEEGDVLVSIPWSSCLTAETEAVQSIVAKLVDAPVWNAEWAAMVVVLASEIECAGTATVLYCGSAALILQLSLSLSHTRCHTTRVHSSKGRRHPRAASGLCGVPATVHGQPYNTMAARAG